MSGSGACEAFEGLSSELIGEPISTAATVCGLTTHALSAELLSANQAVCPAKTTNLTKGRVVWS